MGQRIALVHCGVDSRRVLWILIVVLAVLGGVLVDAARRAALRGLGATIVLPCLDILGGRTLAATQGKAEFTMEFSRDVEVPANISEELLLKYQERLKAEGKK